MSLTGVAIPILVGLLAFWLFGGFVVRVGGLLLVMVGAANLALNPQAEAVLVIGIGAAMWLLGHWHYALRHQACKSPLARHIVCRWGADVARLDPRLGGRRGAGAHRRRGQGRC